MGAPSITRDILLTISIIEKYIYPITAGGGGDGHRHHHRVNSHHLYISNKS